MIYGGLAGEVFIGAMSCWELIRGPNLLWILVTLYNKEQPVANSGSEKPAFRDNCYCFDDFCGKYRDNRTCHVSGAGSVQCRVQLKGGGA